MNQRVPILVKGIRNMHSGYVCLFEISSLSIVLKVIMQGVFELNNYAIFQSRPLGISWLTEGENAEALLHELRMLSLAQFFLDSYKARALSYNFSELPGTLLHYQCIPMYDNHC